MVEINNGDIMQVRLGYVAISKTLNSVTTSSTITYTNYLKLKDNEKISKVIISNLESLIEILKYNEKNHIHFYRISSNLIPLATKKEVSFDYLTPYQSYYQRIKKIIKQSNIRVDMHPNQYCVLNSVKQEVVSMSQDILEYHYKILDAIGIKDKLIILHIGSNTFGKKNSLTRFIHNFSRLPKYLQEIIAIENDDKIFNIEDCLYLSNILDIPIVLDYHHFKCNHSNKKIEEYIEPILKTWKNKRPKMHFSSPKNQKEYRAHHEYINANDFIDFLQILSSYQQDIDIMLEAKGKDEALFRLVRELKYKKNYKFIDETSFEI